MPLLNHCSWESLFEELFEIFSLLDLGKTYFATYRTSSVMTSQRPYVFVLFSCPLFPSERAGSRFVVGYRQCKTTSSAGIKLHVDISSHQNNCFDAKKWKENSSAGKIIYLQFLLKNWDNSLMVLTCIFFSRFFQNSFLQIKQPKMWYMIH